MPEQVIPLNQSSPENQVNPSGQNSDQERSPVAEGGGEMSNQEKDDVLVKNDSLAPENDKPDRPSLTIETKENGTSPGKVMAESSSTTPGGSEVVTPNRRASLLKQRSSFLSPTGQHLDKPRQGRRLSFSDESGENLVENSANDFSNSPSKGCCVIA
ncbi:hypothetical protein TrLO_g13141 [Triparma laevis f. longispina]|uniref:Uncharacterized protein n=1 Tax=Triparma laevis f. longispina TaxID=1714387 RepID=A0A9W7CAL6_9STRA|nr:hypothetical protein TrLO_g13141 [Triparma laevis f. longispina]